MARNKTCTIKECPLSKKREVRFKGSKQAKVVFYGESPGYKEEIEGDPFVGDTGDLAKECCKEAGVRWSSLFLMNSSRCRIDKKNMTTKEIATALKHCRIYSVRTLKFLKPKVIVLAGDFALKQVLKKSGITKIRSQGWIWSKEFNCWCLPTFHPAYILRNRALKPILVGDLRNLREFIENDYEPPTSQEGKYSEIQSLREIIDAGKPTGVDTEGQGLDWIDPMHITISLSVSNKPGTGHDLILYKECTKKSADYTISWMRVPEGKKKPELTDIHIRRVKGFERKLDEIEELLAAKNLKKYLMNWNYDKHSINTLFMREREYHPVWNNVGMDVQAAAHVIEENMFKMADLTLLQQNFTRVKSNYNQAFAQKWGKADMLLVPPEERTPYACADADVTLQVANGEKKILVNQPKQASYIAKMVMPTLESLFMLEENGAYIDMEALPKVKTDVHRTMMLAQIEALKVVPKDIILKHREANKKKKDKIVLTRTNFVRDVVFHPKGFACKIVKKTKGGDPSIDKNVRKELIDGRLTKKARIFLEAFGEFSEFHTLYSRYLNGFQKNIKHDGRIHTNNSLTVAVTGRVSSSKPNMMNNPKRSKSSKKIRRLIAAPPGWLLLAVDESQSELRWLAHVANDPTMIKVFRDTNADIHTNTAMSLVGKQTWKELTQEQIDKRRFNAKAVNFGLIFGMTTPGFVKYAKNEYGLDLTMSEADSWITIFFNTYRRLPIYHREIVELCRRQGYVESPLGRRRRLPEINSDEKFLRFEAERQAINHPIQSPSSDTVLIALNEMRRDGIFNPDEFRASLFIHDELVFEVKDNSKVTDYAKAVKHYMEHPPLERDFGVKLRVPLVADPKVGKNSAEMEEIQL